MRVRLFMLVILIFPVISCLAFPSDPENSIVFTHLGGALTIRNVNATAMNTGFTRVMDVRERGRKSYRRVKSGRRNSKRFRRYYSRRHIGPTHPATYYAASRDNSVAGKLMTRNFESRKGRLPWPVASGTISLKYGPHEVLKGVNHNSIGITIKSTPGIPVTAVSDGHVQSVFNVFDQPVVMIRHGNYFTTYSNLSVVSVSKDAEVKAGQELGKVSENGQLDFIISDHMDNHFDPEVWLKKQDR